MIPEGGSERVGSGSVEDCFMNAKVERNFLELMRRDGCHVDAPKWVYWPPHVIGEKFSDIFRDENPRRSAVGVCMAWVMYVVIWGGTEERDGVMADMRNMEPASTTLSRMLTVLEEENGPDVSIDRHARFIVGCEYLVLLCRR